ncbi:MAG: carbohydrate kinase [Bacteroidales bacterium]|nr:carbohydrate kinase [Bacteroidales bacterium]
MGKVIGIGELLFDVFPTGKKLGGAPVNFAYHVQQLGLESLAVSAVGKDELGDEIMLLLAEKEINTCVQRVDAPTGTVQVSLDKEGVPTFTIMENVAWDMIPFSETLAKEAAECSAICFGSLAQRSEVSHKTIRRIIGMVPDEALVIFDINLRQHFYSKALIEESLRASNILKINETEFDIVVKLLGCPDADYKKGSLWIMKQYGIRMVILTCGADGSYIFTGEEESFEPTPKVDVADTVGAGDSFTAAFCASLLKGASIKEAHRKAVAVSAFVCTQTGAMPKLSESLL